jgi:hypothetical protein
VFNIDESSFEAGYCVPGSLGTIEYQRNYFIQVYGGELEKTSQVIVMTGNNTEGSGLAFDAPISFGDIIIEAPVTFFRDIYDRIQLVESTHLNNSQSGWLDTFGNCQSTLTSLPPITIHFETLSLVVYPDDYTKPVGGDRFQLLLYRRPYLRYHVILNPLHIKGVNFRTTDNEIMVCDSLNH